MSIRQCSISKEDMVSPRDQAETAVISPTFPAMSTASIQMVGQPEPEIVLGVPRTQTLANCNRSDLTGF
jgi:hypothetical protein